MMRKLGILMLLAVAAIGMQAQEITDGELAKLVSIVKMLRTKTPASYNNVFSKLKADRKWTQMDETQVNDPALGHAANGSFFRLNIIMNNVDDARQYVATQGNMLNGEHERYNYSMYEHALKAGKSVSFELKKRKGPQTLVIVPFSGKAAKISASVSIASQVRTDADGTVIITCPGKDLADGNKLTITISNGSEKVQSFVLLNHNTRKQ